MKTANTILTVFALLLAIPSILILASWNALPGDSLYPIKTGLEKTLLALTGATPLASRFSVNFTERRFAEAGRLLDMQSSSIGYSLLTEDVEKSKNIIAEKQDSQSAQVLIAKIEEYQKAIEQKQKAIEAKTPTLSNPAPKPTVCIQVISFAQNPTTGVCTTFPNPCVIPEGWKSCRPDNAKHEPRPTPAPISIVVKKENQEDINNNLEDAKNKLEEIKNEIKKETPAKRVAPERAKEGEQDKQVQQKVEEKDQENNNGKRNDKPDKENR